MSSSVCNCPKIWSLLDKVLSDDALLAGGRGGAKGGRGGATGKDLLAETVKRFKIGQFYSRRLLTRVLSPFYSFVTGYSLG